MKSILLSPPLQMNIEARKVCILTKKNTVTGENSTLKIAQFKENLHRGYLKRYAARQCRSSSISINTPVLLTIMSFRVS